MRQISQCVIVAFMCTVAACGSGNSLGGSEAQVVSLAFNTVRIFNQSNNLAIQYTSGSDVICKIVVDLTNLTLSNDYTLSSASFLEHVTLTRSTTAGDTLAKPANGNITFNQYSKTQGHTVSGNFYILLENGNTLIGTFDANLS